MPDTLPIIGNDYGDWLCLRIARDGTLAELIHWSHCGGDWLPYGRNLAEGLLYDAAQRILHPHCNNMDGTRSSRDQVFGAAQWACEWVERGPQVWQVFSEASDEDDTVDGSNRVGLVR